MLALAKKAGLLVFGKSDWSKRVGFGKKDIGKMPPFPWKQEFLKSTCPLTGGVIEETHFAFAAVRVAGSPVHLLMLHDTLVGKGNPQPDLWYAWFKSDAFGVKAFDRQWYLSPLGLYGEIQDAFTPPTGYRVATAVEEFAKLVFYWQKTKVYANKEQLALCSDFCTESAVAMQQKGPFASYRVAVGYRDDHVQVRGLKSIHEAHGYALTRI
jgi:hypothetical protein